jgi:hypothetical protein
MVNHGRNYFSVIPGPRIIIATLLLALASAIASFAHADSFTASVDRSTVAEQETLQLKLTYEPQIMIGSPDLSALKQDFDIVQGPGRVNSYRSYNGQSQSQTEWTLMLAPRHTGQLQIPAITFKGQTSNPITITVNQQSSQVQQQNGQDAFFDIQVDPQPVYYVQGQILYTEKLYYRVNHQDPTLSDLQVEDARVEALGDARQYISVINGERVGVYERRYAIYPEKAGKLVIPGQRFQAVASSRSNPYDRWTTRQNMLSAVSRPIELDVAPMPASYPALPWLPAKNLTLTDQFSADPQHWTVGEAVTRTISIHTDGLSASQIVLPQPALPEGLKRYPDQPDIKDQDTDEGVSGDYKLAVALVPTQPGSLTLPELTIAWWNTSTNELEYARLPERTYQVSAANGAMANGATANEGATRTVNGAASDNPSNSSSAATASPAAMTAGTSGNDNRATDHNTRFWLIIRLVLLLTNLATLMLWWRSRNQTDVSLKTEPHQKTATNLADSWQALRRACQQGNPQEVRTRLLEWSRLALQPAPVTLQDLIRLVDDDALQDALAELDACLYSRQSNSAWNGNNLLLRIEQWQTNRKQVTTAADNLPPLYPA